MKYPQRSDDFKEPELAQVWEFNHVPHKEMWSLKDRPGYFRIYAQYARGFYWARNSLTQKVTGPYSTGTVLLDATGLKEGDFAGNGIMGRMMYQFGVRKKEGRLWLEMRQSYRDAGEEVVDSLELGDITGIYLRTETTREGTTRFHYSLDGRKYQRFGPEGVSNFWGFLGIRHALCCYNVVKGNPCGYADFDYFELESAHRGNHYDAFAGVDFSQYDDREGMELVRLVGKRPMQFVTGIESGDWLVFNNLTFKKRPARITLELKAVASDAVLEIRRGSLQGETVASCPLRSTDNRWDKQSFQVRKLKKKEKLYFIFRNAGKDLAVKNFVFE